MERLEGKLRIDEGLVADVELTAGKSKHLRKVRATCFLELADGTLVSVDASQAKLTGWKSEVAAEGCWDELDSHVAAAPFSDVAPGPHVRATLRVQGPEDLSRVVVQGEVSRGSPAGVPETYRGNASSVPVHIEAAEIRCGGLVSAKDGSEKTSPRKRKQTLDSERPPRSAWLLGWLIMTSIVGGIALIAVIQALLVPATQVARLGAWSVVCASALLTATAASNLRPLPAFARDQELGDLRSTVIIIWAIVGILPLMGIFMTFTESIPLVASGNAAAVSLDKRGQVAGLRVDFLCWYSVLFHAGVAALAIAQWIGTFKAAAHARVLTAPLSPSSAVVEGKWIVAEGVVRADKGPVRECRHTYLGKNQGTSTTCSGAPFVLKTPAGELEVGLGGIWGAAEGTSKDKTTIYRVAPGDNAVVAGRVAKGDNGIALSGKGEESLFLYAGGRGSARRELLFRARLRHVLLVIAALAVGAAVYVGCGPRSTASSGNSPAGQTAR